MPWRACPRILSEHLVPLAEPLALLLGPGERTDPASVARGAARALLDLAEVAPAPWPAWLAPHQVPAARRLTAIIGRYGGALLADATGLGKSYVALAVALAQPLPLTLVVPAVLVNQWKALLTQHDTRATVLTHESLSGSPNRLRSPLGTAYPPNFWIVDEAHRFRNPDTRRFRALAMLVVGSPVLLVTATPVHNRLGDLFTLFRLFLRDHALGGLGVPSLKRAAREECDRATMAAVAARLTVARSRNRVRNGYAAPLGRFAQRESPEAIRVGTAPAEVIEALVRGVGTLRSGGTAAALFRLTLLRRLASSLPAFRASLGRYREFVELSLAAAREGRSLTAAEFRRLFPGSGEDAVQLALFPLLLEAGKDRGVADDRPAIAALHALDGDHTDPKAATLERLLHEREGKTIVFTDAAATARHLTRWLGRRHRVAAVYHRAGTFGSDAARREEVLAAFAPRAQSAAPPSRALETDVLIATDLLSEGLNLQDAARVVHYDLPWTPARLAQRVGRIDRLGTLHERLEIVTFLPPASLVRAVRLEERLAVKVHRQRAAGAAQVEPSTGQSEAAGSLDWCDRLQTLAPAGESPPDGIWAVGCGEESAVVLVVGIGPLVEAIVVDEAGARADPARATRLLEGARRDPGSDAGARDRLSTAIRTAGPLVRERLGTIESARWRADDRDRLARRLIPWVLSAARRVARKGDARQLADLDALVSRLTLGMTAGEEGRLDELLERRSAIAIRDLIAWHERLPPVVEPAGAPEIRLVAALVLSPAAASP